MDISKIFKKSIQLGSQNIVGNKDLKKLRSNIEIILKDKENNLYVEEIFKNEIRVAKISQTKIFIFFSQNEPIFFEFDNILFPTVYTLWRYPSIIYSFVTYSCVSSHVLNGADLMLPGVIHPSDGFSKIQKGDVCSIRVFQNELPFSVGRCLMDVNQLNKNGLKGKCVECFHTFGDALWQLGKKNAPGPSFTLEIINEDTYEETKYQNKFSINNKNNNNENENNKNNENENNKNNENENNNENEKNNNSENEKKNNKNNNNDEKKYNNNMHNNDKNHSILSDNSNEEEENIEENIEGNEEEEENKLISKMQDMSLDEKYIFFTPEQMDEVLNYCLLEVLTGSVTDDQLPFDISALYGRMVSEGDKIIYHPELQNKLEELGMNIKDVLCCLKKGEKEILIDVKRSTHKKLIKFMQPKIKEKILQVKVNRGVTHIIKINRQHPILTKYVNINKDKTKNEVSQKNQINSKPKINEEQQSTKKEIEVKEVYQIRECHHSIFSAVDVPYGKNIFFSLSECRNVLDKYIKEVLKKNVPQNENSRDIIKLDAVLTRALLDKNENIQELHLSEVFQRFQNKLQIYHFVLHLNQQSIQPIKYVHGPCPNVKISVEIRRGRKHCTYVEGLMKFLEDLNGFADFLQKKLACASSTYDVPGKNKELGIMVQGNVSAQVAEILITKYGVPKKYIEILQKKK